MSNCCSGPPEASPSCCDVKEGMQTNNSLPIHLSASQDGELEKKSCSSTGSEVSCGCSGNPVFDGVDPRYRVILWTVIALNGGMFLIELLAGKLAGSQALQADALDFLGDSVTYGMSLAVIGLSLRVRSTAAMIKGVSLMTMGVWILGSTLYQILYLDVPKAEIMGFIGFLALATNVAAVLLLRRYKDGDANIRSVWLCSRNDAIGNLAVMGASLTVFFTQSAWPDIVVALAMAGLFLHSASLILHQSRLEYRQALA